MRTVMVIEANNREKNTGIQMRRAEVVTGTFQQAIRRPAMRT